MERQLRNHHQEPLRGDPRPRIGRNRQESLSLRRTMRPEPKFEIDPPLGFSQRSGSGSIVSALWVDKVRHVVGRYTVERGKLVIDFTGDKGEVARELHSCGRLIYSAGSDGSLVAWFVAETR
ncbi:MAG: hypothetical protein KGQ51_18695 [Planctomycetes bacterium]|nr:hypothetical protein [Planctomycetota bacterium]